MTKAVKDEFRKRMINCESKGILRKDGFIFLKGKLIQFRVPGIVRELKYISIEELAVGAFSLIQQNIGVPRQDLYRTMSKQLGFNKTGKAAIERFDRAITFLMGRGVIVEKDGMLYLSKK